MSVPGFRATRCDVIANDQLKLTCKKVLGSFAKCVSVMCMRINHVSREKDIFKITGNNVIGKGGLKYFVV